MLLTWISHVGSDCQFPKRCTIHGTAQNGPDLSRFFWRNFFLTQKTSAIRPSTLKNQPHFFPCGHPPPQKKIKVLKTIIPANNYRYNCTLLIINSLRLTSVNPGPSRPPASVDVSNPEAPGRKKPRRLGAAPRRAISAGKPTEQWKKPGLIWGSKGD